MVDEEKLKKYLDELIELKLVSNLPNNDTTNLKKLFRYIREFYRYYPPENIRGELLIVYDEGTLVDLNLNKKEALTARDGQVAEIIQYPAIIQINENEDFLLWNNMYVDLALTQSDSRISYQINENESIWIGSNRYSIPTSPLKTRSIFSNPTYWNLDTALNDYYCHMAKKCVCRHISDAWHDDNRIRWKNAPEEKLRDSLWFYLKATLRGATEVKREQNVTDDNPVDIKVTWNFSKARALIEVKWLGVSVDSDLKITANYTNSRAVQGAKQICRYIEDSIQENYDLHFKGYLVIFDGRRRGANDLNVIITYEKAWYYKDSDITGYPEEFINNKYASFRFFIEPFIAC